MADLRSVVSELGTALDRKQFDAANNLLSRAKRSLLLENALIPTPSTPPQTFSLAREVLELGALASIRQTDAPAFTRYYQQLQAFYDLERHAVITGENIGNVDVKSSQRSKITGLYLLLLLSMGDSTSFHSVLEGLVEEASLNGKSVEDDPYIKYPVELERNLMEGSYDKVWSETNSERVPSEDFALFSNVSCVLEFIPCIIKVIGANFSSNRFSLEPFAAKLQTAPRKRTRLCPFPTPRTSSSSNPRAPLLNSPNSVDGFFVMDGYISLLSRSKLPGLRRTFCSPAVL